MPARFFTADTVRGRRFYGGKIIPNRGAWIEIETDQNNVIWVKVDRKRKVPATALLRAFATAQTKNLLKLFTDVNTHPNIDFIEETLKKDPSTTIEERTDRGLQAYSPGDLATADNAKSLIHAMFCNFDRYDLGRVGVYKFNTKFSLGLSEAQYDGTKKSACYHRKNSSW